MPADVSIRDARPSDADLVAELARELGYEPPAIDALVAEVAGRDDHLLQVAEGDGQPIGYVLAHAHHRLGLGGTMVSLDELVVTESARGAGVGSALVASARRWADELGALRFELVSSRFLESYRSGFYERRGFEEVPSAVLRAPLGVPDAPATRDARRHFEVGAYGFLVRDGKAKSRVEAPCNKKLCFTSLRPGPLAAILYELSLRDDCWFVKLDPQPRDNGMVRGRCFLTDPDEVARVWLEYKGTDDVLCTIQDDDFTEAYRPPPPPDPTQQEGG